MKERIQSVCYISITMDEGCCTLLEEHDMVVQYHDAKMIKSLTTFIAREKAIKNMDFIVVDVTDTTYSDEDIVGSMEMLMQFSNARPIVIAPKTQCSDILFGKLSNMGIKNLVIATTQEELLKELSVCISYDGKGFSGMLEIRQAAMVGVAKGILEIKLNIPQGFRAIVSIGSPIHRIGTTTQAFSIYQYAKEIGFHPIIIDNSQKMMQLFIELYGDMAQKQDDHIKIKEICFAQDILPQSNFNFYIYDMGVLKKETMDTFLSADIPIVVAGTKPWELAPMGELFNEFQLWENKRILKVFSFTTEESLLSMKEYFGEFVFAAPYSPEIFKCANKDFYNGVLLQKLKELCSCG